MLGAMKRPGTSLGLVYASPGGPGLHLAVFVVPVAVLSRATVSYARLVASPLPFASARRFKPCQHSRPFILSALVWLARMLSGSRLSDVTRLVGPELGIVEAHT